MSNKDQNGLELPWELLKLDLQEGQYIPYQKTQTIYKIIPNPLWKHHDLNSPEFAISSCFRDAILHMNQTAAHALMLHIQDAHKWKE